MTVLWFLLLVSGLIAVHEIGHYACARFFHIRVLKLSVGFGPTIFSLHRRGTEYALSAVPLGGYVRLLGEQPTDTISAADRAAAFRFRPAWQRFLVILAGPAANFLFPVLIFSQIYAIRSDVPSATIGSVLADQPAQEAGLRPGDRILAIDGERVRTWEDFHNEILDSAGKTLRLTFTRPGIEQPIEKYIIPRAHTRPDPIHGHKTVGLIGVVPHFQLPLIGIDKGANPALRAGLNNFDQVFSVQGRSINNRFQLQNLLRPTSASVANIVYLRYRPSHFGFAAVGQLAPEMATVAPELSPEKTSVRNGGIDYGIRPADCIVYAVATNSPAAALGLRAGDLLVAVDNVGLDSWETFAQLIEERPTEEHVLEWQNEEGNHRGRFHLGQALRNSENQREELADYFGVDVVRATNKVPEVTVRQSFFSALRKALARALSVTFMFSRVLVATVIGKLPASSIGGPLLVYQIAGIAAEHGPEQFFVMGALVSLNIGLLNLLPIPLLDGGQALLLLVETGFKRQLSNRVYRWASRLGVVLLGLLLLLALRNDLLRLLVS